MFLIYNKTGGFIGQKSSAKKAAYFILHDAPGTKHALMISKNYLEFASKNVLRSSMYPDEFWELVKKGVISMARISFTELRARRLDPSGFGSVQRTYHNAYIVNAPDQILGKADFSKLGFVDDRVEENKILQIDPATGVVVNEFISSSEAQKQTKILASSICHVASGQRQPNGIGSEPNGQKYLTAGGYLWRWKHPKKKVHTKKASSGKPKSCTKIDAQGKALAHYASLTAAAEANNISVAYVYMACSGNIDERRYPKKMRPKLLKFEYE